jgi:hypothetical protein
MSSPTPEEAGMRKAVVVYFKVIFQNLLGRTVEKKCHGNVLPFHISPQTSQLKIHQFLI